jgi:hypothetical protein
MDFHQLIFLQRRPQNRSMTGWVTKLMPSQKSVCKNFQKSFLLQVRSTFLLRLIATVENNHVHFQKGQQK